MVTHINTSALLLPLLLTLLVLPPSTASSRQLSSTSTADVSSSTQHRARTLQGTTVEAVPGSAGPGDAGDAAMSVAKEGEQCNSGGNIMPISCEPGFTCNLTAPLPTPGTPGFHPDHAALGTCVKSPNASVAGGGEGESCSTAGGVSSVGCSDGLYCDVSASMVPPGMPETTESSTRGVCRSLASFGDLCFAGGIMVLPDEPASDHQPRKMSTPIPDLSWSAPCSSGLVCFVLDPSPPETNHSIQIQNKMASLDMSTRFLGYCVNQTDVPDLNSRQGSGTQAGVCKVGIPLTKAESPCQVGLTCVTPSSILQDATAGAVTYGVCADPAKLIPQLVISPVGGNSTSENVAAPAGGSQENPAPSFSSSPNSASEVLHRCVGLTGLALVLSMML